jgi:pimeloyl-ACP methyl ester carboxylesterase
MPRLTTRGAHATELHYEDIGTGRPVVLIHGWPLSHRMWEKQVAPLAEAGFRVIAYDRRGFGDSGKPGFGYDYDTFADDLHALVEQLDLRDATLAGFSMGGGEVARYLGRHGSGRVRQAMLLGAVTPSLMKTDGNPEGVDRAVLEEMRAKVREDRIAFLDGFFPGFYGQWLGGGELVHFSKWMAWAASPIATERCVTAFGETDFSADLARFDVPTLIVHGDADKVVPIAASAERAAKMVRGSRLEVIPGAPHGFAATHADRLNALMVDFLRDG